MVVVLKVSKACAGKVKKHLTKIEEKQYLLLCKEQQQNLVEEQGTGSSRAEEHGIESSNNGAPRDRGTGSAGLTEEQGGGAGSTGAPRGRPPPDRSRRLRRRTEGIMAGEERCGAGTQRRWWSRYWRTQVKNPTTAAMATRGRRVESRATLGGGAVATRAGGRRRNQRRGWASVGGRGRNQRRGWAAAESAGRRLPWRRAGMAGEEEGDRELSETILKLRGHYCKNSITLQQLFSDGGSIYI